MLVKDITENQFEDEVLKHEGIAVAKFYGSWCGPCKMLAGILDGLSDEYNAIKVVNLNVDEAMNLAKEYSVMTVPTLIFFKDGAEVEKIVGFRNAKQLNETFTKYLNQ